MLLALAPTRTLIRQVLLALTPTLTLIWQVLYDSEEIEGDDVVDSTPFIPYREVQCNTMDEADDKPLEPGKRYVICPSTFKPGMVGEFRLIVYTTKPLDQPPELLPRLHELTVRGSWTERTAGGCRNYVTWRKNDQYLLHLGPSARASVVMFRANAVPPGDKALFSNKKAKSSAKKKKTKVRRGGKRAQCQEGQMVGLLCAAGACAAGACGEG